MFIYANALKNLLRNRGRNILVSVILLVVMTVTTISLAIGAMSDSMIEGFADSFGVEATILPDWANAMKWATVADDGQGGMTSNFETVEIPVEQYVAFADSKYVMDTLFLATAQYASDALKPLELSSEEEVDLDGLLSIYGAATVEELIEKNSWLAEHIEELLDTKPTAIGRLWGYSNASLMNDFRRNEKRLSAGRMFENPGEVLISEELAELNNLKLGDKITISGSSVTHDSGTVDLTVVGIFESLKDNVTHTQTGSGMATEITAGKNDLIVSFDTIHAADFHRVTPGEMTYFLTDPEAPALFLQELREKGLHEMFKLDYDLESYTAIVEPMRDMSGVAMTFGIVILVTGAAILVFLSVINIRERKYEVGVLRAIGMKKHQLARGMVYEALSLVTICTLIGLPLGILLAKPIAGVLLDTSESVNMAVSFNAGILSLIVAVAIALGVLSSLIGILYITKYEPMKILQERN